MNYEEPYASSYNFKLVAKFKEHLDLDGDMFVYYMDEFVIRDYCVGMTLYGPPHLYKNDNFFTIEESEDNAIGAGKGETEENPWRYKLTKYLKSSPSIVEMDYVNYQ